MAGCRPPPGTAEGTCHWLGHAIHGGAVQIERALWWGDRWTRWLDTEPTGDFASLAQASYIGPALTPKEQPKPMVLLPAACEVVAQPQRRPHDPT